MQELRKALHGEQKGCVGSSRSLQDLRKVPIPEWGKLIQHDTEQRLVRPPALVVALVPLPDDQLQVLQQHFAESPHRLRVLVDVQGHKQNELLFNHLIQGKKVFVGTCDDAQLVIQKRHAFVQQALDLRHTFPVLEGLIQVLHGHLEVEFSLRADPYLLLQAPGGLGDLFPQYRFINRHDQNVVEVELQARVGEDANNVREVIQLVL